MVRRGIDRLKRRHGDAEGSSSGGSSGSEPEGTEAKGRSAKGKGKAREQVVDVVDSLTGGSAPAADSAVGSKKKRTRAKQVSVVILPYIRQDD